MVSARTIPLHVRVSPEIHAEIQGTAEKERRKVAALLAILVEEALAARRLAGVSPAWGVRTAWIGGD